MSLPTPEEVYERLASDFDEELAQRGMRRVSRLSYPCWDLPHPADEQHLFLSLQVDDKASDEFSGGGFRVEVEKSAAARPAFGLKGRALFFQLLKSAELAVLLAQQNRVIQALPRPPVAQVEAYPAGPVRRQYLSYFGRQSGFDPVRSWLRYRTLSDVDDWTHVLRPLLSPLVERADEYLQRGALHMGRGSLVEARS